MQGYHSLGLLQTLVRSLWSLGRVALESGNQFLPGGLLCPPPLPPEPRHTSEIMFLPCKGGLIQSPLDGVKQGGSGRWETSDCVCTRVTNPRTTIPVK